MNQKLLTRLFYGFLVTVVIVALFLLNYQIKQNKKRPHNKNGINVVSRVGTDTSSEAEQQAKHSIINVTISDSSSQTGTKEFATTKPLSYLDIYRQLQTAKACRSFFQFWRRNGLEADITSAVRPPLNHYGGLKYLSNEKAPLITGQTETLKTWVRRCHELWQTYGEFEPEPNHLIPKNDVADTIKKRLLATVAKTNKELAIKKVRHSAAQWQQSFVQIETVLVGEDSGDQVELQLLRDEIEQIKQQREDLRLQWLEARDSDESLAQTLSQQRSDLQQQTHQLEVEINSQKVLNQDQLLKVLNEFKSHDLALNRLMQTDDADVFYEVLNLYQGNQNQWLKFVGFSYHSSVAQPANQYIITPGQLVFDAAQGYNRTMHAFELRYAAQLYLCDLGWNCGANSPIVMSYCLSGIYSQPAACGQSLQEFLRNDLISPNRWQDVMVFKDLYKELYGE